MKNVYRLEDMIYGMKLILLKIYTYCYCCDTGTFWGK